MSNFLQIAKNECSNKNPNFLINGGYDGNKPKVLQYKCYTMLKELFSTFLCKIGTTNYMIKKLKYIRLSTSLSLKFNTC